MRVKKPLAGRVSPLRAGAGLRENGAHGVTRPTLFFENPHKWLGNRSLQMIAAVEKLGNVAGKLGKTLRKLGREAEKLGKMAVKLGTAMRKLGTVAFALGNVAGKLGMVVWKLGTAGGELGTVLRNWGSRLRNWQRLNLECGDTSPLSDWETCLPVPKRGHIRAVQSRRVWGVKFLRSGREPFARWLSIRLPTVPRMLMKFGQKFSKNDGGRQAAFLIFPATLFSSP